MAVTQELVEQTITSLEKLEECCGGSCNRSHKAKQLIADWTHVLIDLQGYENR